MNLTQEEREKIQKLLVGIQDLARSVKEPIDPKVESCLELSFAMLVEQLECDKKYEWGPMASEDDRFFYDTGPDVDELNGWLDAE